MIYEDLEFINGQMEENILDNGLEQKCMEREHLHGQMEENIKDNIKMIKNLGMVSLNGLTVEFIPGIGKMESSMEKENIKIKMDRQNKDNGLKERE